MADRSISLPPLLTHLGPAYLARIMESEVEVVRSFVRHMRLYEQVLREAHPDADLSFLHGFDSDMVKGLVFLQEQTAAMKKMAETEDGG